MKTKTEKPPEMPVPALVDTFDQVECNALMTALRNAADVDREGAPYPDADLIYLYLVDIPKALLVCELVEELHKIGFTILRVSDMVKAAEDALKVAGKSPDQNDVTYCTGRLDALLEIQESIKPNN